LIILRVSVLIKIKVVQQIVNVPSGDLLVLVGETITTRVADAAERLEVLDEPCRSAGGSLTDPSTDRFDTTITGLTIEQAQGRRAQRAIYRSGAHKHSKKSGLREL